jgi:hypothetical protein
MSWNSSDAWFCLGDWYLCSANKRWHFMTKINKSCRFFLFFYNINLLIAVSFQLLLRFQRSCNHSDEPRPLVHSFEASMMTWFNCKHLWHVMMTWPNCKHLWHVMMTCTFLHLALSNFESYFYNSTTCIKGLVFLWNYINTLIFTTLLKFHTIQNIHFKWNFWVNIFFYSG